MTLIFKKIFSWENILVKSSYYEKGKREKKEYPPFSSTTQPHSRNNSEKKTPFPSQYHLIKLLYFSSSLKPHIIKKKGPMLSSPNFLKK
jgi:hypothetical protein